jgi:hypothetical protein
MSEHFSDQAISAEAEKCLARMSANLREAVDRLIKDSRFATYDDHATLLLAIAETCRTKEEALALLRGAVRCIEDGDLQVGRRVTLENEVRLYEDKSPFPGVSMSDALSAASVDNDWQFLWSRLGDREFCGNYWNQYVAVFMAEVLGSGSTDSAARDAAVRTLSQRGMTRIPPDRFVVDFVGDA